MSGPEFRLRRIYSLLSEISCDAENITREYITEQCAAERERCAKIADKIAESNINSGDSASDAEIIAAKIRSGE